MAALPQTRDIFRSGEDPGPKVGPVRGGSRGSSMLSAHRLLLRPSDTIDVRHVLQLLRDSYHEVVLASREREAHGRHQQHRQLAREQSSRPACGVVHGLQGELPPNGAKPHEPFAPKAVHGLCVARPSAQTRSSLGSNPLSPGHAVNANKAHIASWSLAGAPAPANTTAKPARREHSSWLGRLAPRPARISPSASAAVACGVAPPTSASVALLVGPPLARQADPASKLPVAQLAEPNASGAFPASFHEQMTTSYFARQRHGFAGETGGNDAPQCVLPEDAIVSLLTRALSQAQARESYVSSTLAAVSWSAALLLLLVMLVDEAVVLAGDAAYDEDLVELTLAAPGRWHLYHAVIMLATSFALVMLVLQQTNTRRVRLAAVMVSVQSALQACAFVGLLARSAIVAVRSGSGGTPTRTATSSGTTDSVSRLAVYLAAEALSAALLAAAAFLVARAAVREQRLQCTNVVRSAVHAQLFQLVLDAFAVVSVVQAFAFVAKLGVDLMADGVEGSFSRLTVGAVVADIAASLLAPCVLRMPSFRQASQDVLNGLFWSAGAHAPLAALIGFGTSLIQEPVRVVSEAMASFEPVVLDVRAFRLLDFHDARSGIGMAGGRAFESASDASFSGSRPAGGAAHPDPSALEKVEVNLDVLAALERGRDSQGERNQRGSAQSHGAPAGASGALPKVGSGGSMAASLNAGNGRDVSPLAPSRRHNMALESMLASVAARLHDGEMAGNAADFYVVHSPVDHPEDRKAALREMARAFTAKRGRQPSVWLDVRAHAPQHIARVRRCVSRAPHLRWNGRQCPCRLLTPTLLILPPPYTHLSRLALALALVAGAVRRPADGAARAAAAPADIHVSLLQAARALLAKRGRQPARRPRDVRVARKRRPARGRRVPPRRAARAHGGAAQAAVGRDHRGLRHVSRGGDGGGSRAARRQGARDVRHPPCDCDALQRGDPLIHGPRPEGGGGGRRLARPSRAGLHVVQLERAAHLAAAQCVAGQPDEPLGLSQQQRAGHAIRHARVESARTEERLAHRRGVH